MEDFAKEQAQQRYQRLKAEAENELYCAEQTLDSELQKGELELFDAKSQLEQAQREIQNGETQLQTGKAQLQSGKVQIALQEQQLADQKQQLIEKKQEILSGLDQIAAQKSSYAAYPPAQARLIGQEQQLRSALAEAEAGLAQAEAGLNLLQSKKDELALQESALRNSESELIAARQQYQSGQTSYQQGREELDSSQSDAQEELNDAREEIDELEEPDIYVLGRDTNIGYASFDSDSSIVNGIANVFPVFFFLVAALVCITTMNRMVEEQRTQIGVLKALGYSESSIMGKYLFYSGSAAGIGCLLGFFGGSLLFPFVIWQAYGMMYTMGEICFVFDPGLAMISLAASMLCSMGTTYFSCRHELQSVPAQLMRPKAPKSGKRILLEYLPFLWNRLSFLVKVSVRNVLRYKKRFCMMVIGIGGCTALLLTGYGVKDSIADIAAQQFGEIQTYGMSLMLKEGVSQAEWEDAEEYLRQETSGFARAQERSMDVSLTDGTVKSITVVVPENPTEIADYWNLHTEQKEAIPYPNEGEAVMSHEFARRNKINIGDSITLTDEDANELTVRVTALSENYIYNYLYLSPDTWEKQTGELAEFRSVYINSEQVADEHILLTRLMNLDAVSSVTVNADTLDRFNSMMVSLDYIVVLIIICAGSLAFVVLYNLTNINITERIREIATIKVLGFYPNETAAYVFRENIFLTAIGAMAGIFLGRWLHWFVMEQINIDMVCFARIIRPQSYLYSIALTFLFACIVNAVMFFKLERINMAESLKSVE